MQIPNFSKIGTKIFEKHFLKISLHFLVEDGKPFLVICELLFYCQQRRRSRLFVSITNGQTDGRTYTFLKSPRLTDSNGITLRGCLNEHRPSAKQYVSTVNCET